MQSILIQFIQTVFDRTHTQSVHNSTIVVVILQAQAYPTDAELQNNLQVAVDWDAYKRGALKSAVNRNPRIQRNLHRY